MTEADWLDGTDPGPMLEFLQGKATDRKVWLFASACGQRNLHKMHNFYYQGFMQWAEQYADGLASIEALADTFEGSGDTDPVDASDAAHDTAQDPYRTAVEEADRSAEDAYHFGTPPGEVRSSQCGLLRDIIGNPFRPLPSIDPAWLTWHDGLLVSMARRMYDSRDFNDMPVLADALEEAGCTDADILGHCRQPGEHVRGCWVVDALLGKS
jgi:hypothetical protein